MHWYLKVLNQYSDLHGRARRKEYWMFVLFNILFSLGALVMDNALGMSGNGLSPIQTLYSIAVFIPSLAVMVRRLHDIGKSGWMSLIALIPVIGTIWLLVLLATDSEPGANQYGDNPKDPEMDISQHLL